MWEPLPDGEYGDIKISDNGTVISVNEYINIQESRWMPYRLDKGMRVCIFVPSPEKTTEKEGDQMSEMYIILEKALYHGANGHVGFPIRAFIDSNTSLITIKISKELEIRVFAVELEEILEAVRVSKNRQKLDDLLDNIARKMP